MVRKSLLAGAALFAAVLVGFGFFWPFHPQNLPLRLPGVVEIQEVRLGSKIGGRVSQVFVKEGSLVKKDETLVTFEVPEIEAQRDQLRAHLRGMEAELEKAKKGPRDEEIRQTRSDLETAEADLTLARQEFDRVEKLFRQGGSNRAEFDTGKAARDRAQGRVASAKARLDLMLAGTRSEEIAEAVAHVAETRAKLEEMEVNLRESIVKAPEHAFVEVVAVRPGDLVAPNQPIVRVLRADDLWVKVYIPETELGKVTVGQKVRVSVDAYPGKQFDGLVRQIAAESEFTPRNVQSLDERRHQVFGAKIQVVDPLGVFKAGMAAEVLFEFAS